MIWFLNWGKRIKDLELETFCNEARIDILNETIKQICPHKTIERMEIKVGTWDSGKPMLKIAFLCKVCSKDFKKPPKGSKVIKWVD